MASLRVISGESLLRVTGAARVPELEAQPFRPGELPESVIIELSAEAAERAESEAAAGVPLGLWLRIATETVRHSDAAAATLDIGPHDIFEFLAETTGRVTTPMAARKHLEYAALLRTPRARGFPRGRRRFEVAVPDQILAGWSIDAAESGETLSDYVSAKAVRAPRECVSFEASAAERGLSLGEWIYASAAGLIRAR